VPEEEDEEEVEVSDEDEEEEEEEQPAEALVFNWTGSFNRDGEDVEFAEVIRVCNNKISGGGVDDDGPFWFMGTIKDKKIKFLKCRAHKVELVFQGKYKAKKQEVKGKWKVFGEDFADDNKFKFDFALVE